MSRALLLGWCVVWLSMSLVGCDLERVVPAANQNSTSEHAADVELVTLSPQRAQHLLYGDNTGGGHLWPGQPGKTPFPQSWSADEIIEITLMIANNPSIKSRIQANGRRVKQADIDGVRVRVVIESPERGGHIITSYPTNLPRNSR